MHHFVCAFVHVIVDQVSDHRLEDMKVDVVDPVHKIDQDEHCLNFIASHALSGSEHFLHVEAHMDQVNVSACENNQQKDLIDQVEGSVVFRLFNVAEYKKLEHVDADDEAAVDDAQEAASVKLLDDNVLVL